MKHFPSFIKTDLKYLVESKEFQDFIEDFRESSDINISGFNLSSFAIFIYYLFKKYNKTFLIIFSDVKESEKFRDDLDFFFNRDKTGYLPVFDDIPGSEHTSEIDSFFYNDVKNKLFDKDNYIFITPEKSLDVKFPNSSSYKTNQILIKKNDLKNREHLVDTIYNYGYKRVEKTTFPKDFSVRASILDIYIPGNSFPHRIEFFDDEIESIRTFDPETQITKEQINSFIIPPLADSELDINKSSEIIDLIEKDSIVFYYDRENLEAINDGRDISNLKVINRFNVLSKGINFPLFDINLENKSVRGLKEFIAHKDSASSNFILLSAEDKQVERLKSIFHKANIKVKKGYFSSSFYYKSIDTYFISENDVLSHSNRAGLKNKRLPSDIDVQEVDIDDITYGDYMVHVNYGIGKFEGLERVEAFGSVNECLKLQYRKNSSIYVPLDKLKYVKKYRNTGENPPKLTKLQSGEWERKKSKTKKSAEKIVDELITLYSIRQNTEGYVFSSDDELQIEMESEFPHQETPDQIRATEEIKNDMESDKPMDRLLCGDVGFGKTEVAIRAAFKAVLDNKQVAVLVPTTILADQHHNSFKNRLDEYPIIIEKLSRFVSSKKQKSILNSLSEGSLDIVIGTHRLLSKDVEYNDLGLLIIDEEHRFGVKNKEKIKNIKKNLDVLSLTATPIPRTLQFSLIGARDFSQINTPPKFRLPIVTEIINFDENFIKERIEFELSRNGQVYFVHNRIKTIEAITVRLRSILPEASIDFAHGRMSEKSLERVINSFINNELDVLVTTTIIESGIDIQNVNTMFINKAHNFGLAQLYQLRGRVGRSNRRAFCYLIAPKMKKLNQTAVKRLKTIKRYTSLGSGYNIAMSDMEIRGAGNLFGIEQSGNIQKIGYDLYVKILQDTFQDKKEEISRAVKIENKEEKSVQERDVNIISPFSSYIPDDYIDSEKMRLDFYKRISESTTVNAIQNIKMEIRDRFGRLPDETHNLFKLSKLKIMANDSKISKVVIKNEGKCEIKFTKDEIINNINRILAVVKNMCNKRNISYKFKPSEDLVLMVKFQNHQILEQLSSFLLELGDNIENK